MLVIKKNKQRFLSVIVFVLLIVSCSNIDSQDKNTKYIRIVKKKINTSKDIIRITDSLVIPYVYTNVVSLNNLPIVEKKQKFFDMLLPAVLVAKTNLEIQQNMVSDLIDKSALSYSDSVFLHGLMVKFKTGNISELIKRMRVPPISIILAQAANESGWGSSRFFILANNPFGMWSFDSHQNRIPASKSRDGKIVYLRKFNNLEEAIDAYLVMLSTRQIFAPFREALQKTSNPFILVRSLGNYSERGAAYVDDLTKLIRSNHLERYDSYKINPSYIKSFNNKSFH